MVEFGMLVINQVQVMFDVVLTSNPHIQSGKLRALALTGTNRLALLPNVPTLDEQGLAGFESRSIYALMAPKGTPRPIIDKLANAVRQSLKDPAVSKKMAALGMDVIASTPEQLAELMTVEAARYQKIVTAGKIHAD